MRRIATSSNHQLSMSTAFAVVFCRDAFQANESQHLLTIWRFSTHGDRSSQDLSTVMVSFHEERTTNVRNASVLVIRFPSSSSSVISRYSAAHLSGAMFLELKSTGKP
ncbi:hypothetical protein TorRG33x02_180150 [Trema orientale]|uniref:Uncharacterized protein n=1 Tax=Trema orientale TaxID=63057 RepID=A0A2P5EKT9_TREOI|nr:hypothetical protein TorRG33x02_180150 [Trema orientale]